MIVAASVEIFDAITQLDHTIFQANIGDKLGDSDQAVLALDTFKRTGDASQRTVALNESAGALSDVLRYSSGSVYPDEALVFPLIEILYKRLTILKECDPGFAKSEIAREPIRHSAEILDAVAATLEASIRSANHVRNASYERKRVTYTGSDVGGGRESITVLVLDVSYRNLDGSIVFERRGEFEPADGRFSDIIARALADAAAVQQRGLAADLARARVTEIRDAAAVAERSLLVSEAHWVGDRMLQREPTELEIAYFASARERRTIEQVAASLADSGVDWAALRASATLHDAGAADGVRARIDGRFGGADAWVGDQFQKEELIRLLLNE
jgi:hypothetical protein